MKSSDQSCVRNDAGAPMVIFNSARLVRKGEELEHFKPEPADPKSNDGAQPGQLTPKMA